MIPRGSRTASPTTPWISAKFLIALAPSWRCRRWVCGISGIGWLGRAGRRQLLETRQTGSSMSHSFRIARLIAALTMISTTCGESARVGPADRTKNMARTAISLAILKLWLMEDPVNRVFRSWRRPARPSQPIPLIPQTHRLHHQDGARAIKNLADTHGVVGEAVRDPRGIILPIWSGPIDCAKK